MSEPRLISPLLDGCIIGHIISCHNGIRCCPAIRESTGEKYIVKIISVPESQIQLDALLLTGAYENADSAGSYFRELAEDIIQESELLSHLSRQEGFTPYEAGQIVPMEDGTGFEVYLLGSYKRSLEEMLADHSMTHLGAVNLGLDICAALAACRRAGYLYVDLKPGNIFHTDEQGYRIGDLGLVRLSSLQYTTIPKKYHSPYSPAEVLDPMAVLGGTVDTYALGLVLYRAYNGGNLPEDSGDGICPPMYADYEMAEIILKACALSPADRWQDPAQMAQALVSYMQRNTVNDTPIIPPVLIVEEPQEEPQEAVEEFLPDREPEPEELAFLQELTQDETAPSEENTSDLADTPVTEETSQMLAQADALIAHVLPEPATAPAMPEKADPEVEPAISDEEAAPAPQPEAQEDTSATVEAPVGDEENMDATIEQVMEAVEAAAEQTVCPTPAKPAPAAASQESRNRKIGIAIASVLIAVLLIGIAFGCWYSYENIYLQHIQKLTVTGTADTMTVTVHSNISDSDLTVICTDSYGNTHPSPVKNGVAHFTGLDPDTRYNIRVEISGFHKLTGMTTTSYNTAMQTHITGLSAVVGPQDGSVLLSFTSEGFDSIVWLMRYRADGVAEQSCTFSGNSICIENLEVGKAYTFTLSSEEMVYLTGDTQITFTAKNTVFAENLAITACCDGKLTASWSAPSGVESETWLVKCYNADGYSKTIETAELSCTFSGLDHSSPCTVEVFASGMSQSVFTTIQANPITITAFGFDTSQPGKLVVRWGFSGTAPAQGWRLLVNVDGQDLEPIVCQENCTELTATGSQYTFTLEATDDTAIFGGIGSFEMP